MKLVTEVSIPSYPFRLDHQSPILMMGSCFTEHIGSLLKRNLFHVSVNPFGVTYNPLSVQTGLESLLVRELYTEDDLDHYNNLWFSFDHYTGFSSSNKKIALQKINLSFEGAKEMLLNARILVITWGTSWVYTNNSTGKVVCNCHKIPASQFTRWRLSTNEIIQSYKTLLSSLFEFNPDLKILFTVSPVRHWKDGAHGNQLSKATLLLAQEALAEQFPEKVFYFPAYEIVMDELRDYRFYTQDMLHTNNQAIEYIWEKFGPALLSEDALRIILDLKPLLKLIEHRPMSQEGEINQNWIKEKDKKIKTLNAEYPYLAWENLAERD